MGKFTDKNKPGFLGGLLPEEKPHTHEYTHTPTPIMKERKTRRVQLLMKESTVDALDAYAKMHDTSRNEIIQGLVDKFLEENA